MYVEVYMYKHIYVTIIINYAMGLKESRESLWKGLEREKGKGVIIL